MRSRIGEEGYLLVGLLVLIFIILLTLGVAAPTVARSLQRDKEVESMHRAKEYQRAIQLYYKKLGHYPGSVDQLMSTNNQRFLRKKYVDPLTGKDDWRLIHMGEAKSQVKGFFGQSLGPAGGSLGAVSGMASNLGGQQTTAGPGGAASPVGAGAPGSPTGPAGTMGAAGGIGPTSAFGGQSASSFGTTSSNPLNGGGGIIVGVGTSKTGASLLAINGDETNYQDWEFIYDPRMDQIRAQASMLGGAPASQPATGFGGSNPMTPGVGSPTGPGTPTGPGLPGGTPNPQR